MTLSSVENNSDQIRFENTRNRLAAIRHAIIGDTSRTVNGQPDVRGFVADMGRLPTNLNELLISPGNDWEYDDTYNLWAGWNGPYLASTSLTGTNAFRDGWGNVDANAANDANNFGWTVTSDATGFTAVSSGVDNAVGGAGIYELDYPVAGALSLVSANEFRIQVTTEGGAGSNNGDGGLWVNFGDIPSCWACTGGGDPGDPLGSPAVSPAYGPDRAACLNDLVTYPDASWQPVHGIISSAECEDLDLVNDSATINTNEAVDARWLETFPIGPESLCLVVAQKIDGRYTGLSDSTASAVLYHYTWNGSSQIIEFIFADGTIINQGQMAYGVFLDDGSTATPCDSTVATGISFPPGAEHWSRMTIVPGRQIQTIERRIIQ